MLHRSPTWFRDKRANPAEWSASMSAKTMAALPVSPVFPGESFRASVYAHTGSLALASFEVFIDVQPDKMSFISFNETLTFQSLQMETVGDSQLRFSSSGLLAGVTDAQVTGTNVHLFDVDFRAADGLTAQVHTRMLKVFTRRLTATSDATIVQFRSGVVFDDRDAFAGWACPCGGSCRRRSILVCERRISRQHCCLDRSQSNIRSPSSKRATRTWMLTRSLR